MNSKLPYTSAQSKEAATKWKASCGHHSISAAKHGHVTDMKRLVFRLVHSQNTSDVAKWQGLHAENPSDGRLCART